MTNSNEVSSTERLLADFAQTGQKKSLSEGIQDRFLTLLVTQMRNQDPLNPLDNAQVTSQMAQISTVSGIDKLNSALNGMADTFAAAQSLQAGALIGRGVLASGDDLTLQQNGAAGGVYLEEPADKVVVTILGPNGEPLRTMDLGAKKAGTSTFSWDGSLNVGGKASEGAYTFEIEAVRSGKTVAAQKLGYGYVQSVSLGSGQPALNTIGLGSVTLDQVRQIL